MNRISLLDELQKIDIQLDSVRKARSELGKSLEDESGVKTAQESFDKAVRAENDLRARLRNLELEAKSLEDHLRDVDARLYGGKVSNPKELTGLERDEEMLKRQKSAVEDHELDLMSQLEQAESKRVQSRASLDQTSSDRQQFTGAERLKLEELTRTETKLGQARQSQIARIAPEDLQVYEDLRQGKKGRAVSHVKGDACAACGYAVPSAVASRARMGTELVYCVNCGRILATT